MDSAWVRRGFGVASREGAPPPPLYASYFDNALFHGLDSKPTTTNSITTDTGPWTRAHSGVSLQGFPVGVFLFEKLSAHPPPVADCHLGYAFLLVESSRFLGFCDSRCALYHRELRLLMRGIDCFFNPRCFERAFFFFAFFALLLFVKRHWAQGLLACPPLPGGGSCGPRRRPRRRRAAWAELLPWRKAIRYVTK